MSHRFMRVDCLLFVAPAATAERLAGDELVAFAQTAERAVDDRRRYYYAAVGPCRVLLVMRNGVPLEALNQPNAYIKALVGWEPGTPGFVLPQDEGKQHTKITVGELLTLTPDAAGEYARANGLEIESLAAILNNAPRADRPGGARGAVGRKRVGGDTRAVSHPVTLLPEQWAAVGRLGGGNRSAGIRKLIEEWQERDM